MLVSQCGDEAPSQDSVCALGALWEALPGRRHCCEQQVAHKGRLEMQRKQAAPDPALLWYPCKMSYPLTAIASPSLPALVNRLMKNIMVCNPPITG